MYKFEAVFSHKSALIIDENILLLLLTILMNQYLLYKFIRVLISCCSLYVLLQRTKFTFPFLLKYLSFFNFNFLIFYIYFFTLQYCIGFAIHQHASAMGVHVFPMNR